ncbi:hypothetical protein [Schumannella luteola]
MIPRRLPALALAGAASLALVGGPAIAAPVPDGTIFTTAWGGGQLYTADPATGALATVGTSSGTDLISGLDVDSATGAGFAVTYYTPPEGGGSEGPAELYRLDPVTGLTELVGTVTLDDEPVFGCLDLDYTGGVILIACDWDATESFIATVDASTAAATVIVPSIDRTQAIARFGDSLIAFGFEGVVNEVDLVDDSVSHLGTVASAGLYPAGADFDAGGRLYVSSMGSMEPYSLWTFDPTTLTGELIGPMSLSGSDVGAGNDISVTLAATADAPALAATGLDVVPLGLAALLVALGGAVLVASRRRAA